jgi:WD40 repeat protein
MYNGDFNFLPAIHNDIWGLCCSPSGDQLVTGGGDRDGQVKVWDLNTNNNLLTIPSQTNKGIQTITYSPLHNHISYGGDDENITIYDLDQQKTQTLIKIEENNRIHKLFYSKCSHLLISSNSQKNVVIYHTRNSKPVLSFYDKNICEGSTVLTSHTDSVHGLDYDNRCDFILSGSHDGTIKLWDPKKPNQPIIKNTLGKIVLNVSFRLDDKNNPTIAAGGSFGGIYLSNETNTTQLGEKYEGDVRRVMLSPDGRFVIGGGWNNVSLWDVESLKNITRFPIGSTALVYSICYNEKRKTIYAGLLGVVGIYDISDLTHKSKLMYRALLNEKEEDCAVKNFLNDELFDKHLTREISHFIDNYTI